MYIAEQILSMKTNIYIYILLTLVGIGNIQAQVSHGGKPLPFVQTKTLSGNLFEEMPSFDLQEQLRIDALNESDLRGGYSFAYKFMTHLNRANSGISYVLEDGTRVWRLGIRSKDALSINILFSEYELPEGAQVFLYNPLQTHIRGSFTSSNNSELGILPVAPLYGDELIVEYLEPANASFPGRLTVGEVNHGYRSLKGYEPGGDRSEFHCMPSPICFQEDEAYEKIARSTVLITIDGITACTGVLVNNTANDGKPYLLTASHCLNKNFQDLEADYEEVAGRIVCFFNYESPTCDTVMRGTEEMSVASSRFRAVNVKNDMALLELLEAPPVYYQPYYAGWNIDKDKMTSPYTGIHHPRASVKRINISEKDIELKTFDISQADFYDNAHWYVKEWTVGSTASGSSGSPLFDSENKLIGALSGGASTCASPNNDFYYALSEAWEPEEDKSEQLKYWLDPLKTNKLALDGLNPYASTPAYRLSNIYDLKLQDSIEVTELKSPASGNMFGINSLKTTEYVEEYTITGKASLFGTYLVTPAIADKAGSLDVEIRVYSGEGKPQTLLHTEKFIPAYTELNLKDSTFQETTKNLNRDQENFVLFQKPIEVSGTFYVGYVIKKPNDSAFAVYNLPKGETTGNTSWLLANGKWTKASEHPSMPFSTSLFIDPVIRYANNPSTENREEENRIRVFMGVGNKTIHVFVSEDVKNATCTLYTINGQPVVKRFVTENQILIPVSDLSSGIYLLNITGEDLFYTQKLIF